MSLLEKKYCYYCLFQNKVLQLLIQALIKCTILNLIFACVSCHFSTQTSGQTQSWHLWIFHRIFFPPYRLLCHQKCGSDICVCMSAGNGQKFNKLLLCTPNISLNLLASWELIARRFYGISNWVSHPSMLWTLPDCQCALNSNRG